MAFRPAPRDAAPPPHSKHPRPGELIKKDPGHFGHSHGHGHHGALARTFEKVREGDPRFLRLALADQGMVPSEGRELADALRAPHCIVRAVDVQNNNLPPEVGRALGKAIEVNRSVRTLDLGMNNLGPKGTMAIAAALKLNENITTLDLALNGIGHGQTESVSTQHTRNPGIHELAESLKINNSLIALDIGYNQFIPGDTVYLAKALRSNIGLVCLDLGGNHLGASDAGALADMLRSNSTLIQLDLHSTGMTPTAVSKLCDALRPREAGAALAKGVAGAVTTSPSDKKAPDISGDGGLMTYNTTLRMLNIADNAFGYQGAGPICRVIRNNRCLTSLDVALNPFGVQNARQLADAVRANRNLMELDLSGTCLGDTGVMLVHEARGPGLVKLEVN